MDVTLAEGLTESAVAGGLLGILLFLVGGCVDAWLLMRLVMRPPAWTRLFQRLERRPWTGRDGFVLVLLLGLSQLLLAFAGQNPPQTGHDGNPSLAELLIQTLLFHATGAAAIALILGGKYLTWRAAFGFHPRLWLKHAGMGGLFYIAMMPVVAVASILYGIVLQALGYEIQPQDVITFMAQPDQPPWIQAYFLVLAVAVAPFVEEMIFRGIAFPLLSRRIGSTGALLLVSLFFACMHFHLPSLLPLFLVSVAFSLAYAYTGSLIAPVVMHAMFNAVSLGAFYLFRDMLFP